MSSTLASAPAPPSRLARAWSLFRLALSGGEEDFTRGPIGRAVFLLAVPMVLEMAMESVFAVVDVFFVSRLGADSVAAVGITESMLTLLYAVALGLAMSTTAMVSRRIGEKDRAGAAQAAVQSLAVGLSVSLLVAVGGGWFAADLLRLMGMSESVVATGSGYTQLMLGGSASILLLHLINGIFRGAGDAAIAMRTLWLANAINLVLDPCLIFGLGPFPELGVTGAALATTIGRSVGVLFQLAVLFSGRHRVALGWADLRLVPAVMLRLVRVSAGGVLQFLIATGSWVALMRIAARSGSEAIAGYTIAIRVLVFALQPVWGLSNAAATLVGQNLGAGQPERAAASVWKAGWFTTAFLAAVTALFMLVPEGLIGLFTREPAVVAWGASALRIISAGFCFYGWGMVMVQAFNGAGDTLTPTWINFFCFWCFQIPLAWGLAVHGGLGARGVFLAVVIAESVLTLIAIFVFRCGSWQQKRI